MIWPTSTLILFDNTLGKQFMTQNKRNLVGEISKSVGKKNKIGKGTCTLVGKDLETQHFISSLNIKFIFIL